MTSDAPDLIFNHNSYSDMEKQTANYALNRFVCIELAASVKFC